MHQEIFGRRSFVHSPGARGRSPRRAIALAGTLVLALLAGSVLAVPAIALAAEEIGAAGGDAPTPSPAALPIATSEDGSSARKAAADAAFSTQQDANRAAKTNQQQVEELDDEAQALLSRYRSIVTETGSYDAYSAQLEQSIVSQSAELAAIEEQMARAGETARDVLPLTSRLIDDLESFIALDAPFHVEERRDRIAGLRTLMGRADVSLSEKYRRVIEAYLIELEFGRTMETYQGVLADTGEPITVDYLRIGRVALLYQTPDGSRTGYWDGGAKRWVEDAGYAQSFRKGARVASKLDAPDLVIAPIPAPKEM